MVCQRECVDCGSTDNVHFRPRRQEFYCDECYEIIEENEESDYNTERDENRKEIEGSGWN